MAPARRRAPLATGAGATRVLPFGHACAGRRSRARPGGCVREPTGRPPPDRRAAGRHRIAAVRRRIGAPPTGEMEGVRGMALFVNTLDSANGCPSRSFRALALCVSITQPYANHKPARRGCRWPIPPAPLFAALHRAAAGEQRPGRRPHTRSRTQRAPTSPLPASRRPRAPAAVLLRVRSRRARAVVSRARTMISAIFIFSHKGEVLISRTYRDDVTYAKRWRRGVAAARRGRHRSRGTGPARVRSARRHSRSAADLFRVHVIHSRHQIRAPVNNIARTSFFHERVENIWIVAVAKQNVDAMMVFVFLRQMSQLFQAYFGKITEDAVRNNFVLIYELLDGARARTGRRAGCGPGGGPTPARAPAQRSSISAFRSFSTPRR